LLPAEQEEDPMLREKKIKDTVRLISSTRDELDLCRRWRQLAPRDRHSHIVKWVACRCDRDDCSTKFHYILGRDSKNWGNQPKHDFREVCWARRLHTEHSYRLCDIAYEAPPLYADAGKDKTARCDKIRAAFTEHFFERLRALHRANQVAKQEDSWHVDLFAVNLERNECGFWEVKEPGDLVQDHQRQLLAFVRYLADNEPAKILKDPAMRVVTEIAHFGRLMDPQWVVFNDPDPPAAA
jgi:hypothetical protein